MASYSTKFSSEAPPIKSSKIKVSQISFMKEGKKDKKAFILKYYPWTKVSEIRSQIASKKSIHPRNVRLFFKNEELANNLKMIDYGIPFKKHPEIFYEIFSYKNDYSLEIYGTVPCPSSLEKIINQALIGFAKGLKPKLLEDGTSGVYQIRNVDKEVIAIFKPFDEEPNAPNNQKGYVNSFGSKSFREGILSGEATIREEATFLLDSFCDKYNFDVPATTFVELCHKGFKINFEEMKIMENDEYVKRSSIMKRFLFENLRIGKDNNLNEQDFFMSNEKYNYIPKKYGTLQKFINSTGVVADYSYSLFTVEEAHKIMILDFRILNCDRNDENILIQKKRISNEDSEEEKKYYKLVPIDHALSFPSCLEIGDFDICWMSWKQANVPFTKEEKDYIESINIIEDMERLNSYIYLRPECWKYFRISNTVLKVCTKYNLTPYEIGSLLYHFDYDNKTPSKIKLIVEKTEKISIPLNLERRIRILSFEGKRNKKNLNEKNEKEKENDENKEHKKRVNSFYRTERGRRKSFLNSTTSVPKDGENQNEDDYINLRPENNNKIGKNKKKSSHKSSKNSNNDENNFDSPFNQLYFQNFVMFLEELIKTEFPEKAKLYEESSNDFELTIEEKYSKESLK